MKRTLSTIYAIVVTLLLATGFLLAFYCAEKGGVEQMIACFIGLGLSFVLSPIVHETGHILFARACGMRVVYAKFFCFKIHERAGKKRLSFTSPFAPDQTQAIPIRGGNMQKRAEWYTLGGLILGGLFFILTLTIALILGYFWLWGILPYAGYLLLLNLAPCSYASGETDALVYIRLKKGDPAQRAMVSAMEIQGRLYQGEPFGEIDKELYFNLPQLCEDEPLFAVMLDLRYRYYLDRDETEKAWDCLNRLAQAQAYLSSEEMQKLCAERTYAYALQGDKESADESGKYAQEYLREDTATAKRVLLAYTLAFGGQERKEQAQALLLQAERALANERIQGVAKLERKLISRLYKTHENGEE